MLDRYMSRTFLEPFFVAAASVVGLYVVAEAFNHLDEFLNQAGGVGEAISRMARVYVLRIPTFLAPVLPIAILLGGAYGVGQLSSHNELAAMKACGVSLTRILTPVYALAVVISMLGFANRELVVPRIEGALAPTIAEWQGKGWRSESVALFLEDEGTFFMAKYNPTTREVMMMSAFVKETGETWVARSAEEVPEGWLFKDVKIADKTYKEKLFRTQLRKDDLDQALLEPGVCSIGILRQLIAAQPDVARLRVYFYGRLAYPLVGIVLVMLGLPFALKSERIQRSRMLGVGICVLICMVFYAVQFIANDLGVNGYLPPAASAALPLVIFGAMGLYMLDTVDV